MRLHVYCTYEVRIYPWAAHVHFLKPVARLWSGATISNVVLGLLGASVTGYYSYEKAIVLFPYKLLKLDSLATPQGPVGGPQPQTSFKNGGGSVA